MKCKNCKIEKKKVIKTEVGFFCSQECYESYLLEECNKSVKKDRLLSYEEVFSMVNEK